MTSKKLREYLRSHVLGLVAIFVAFTGTAVAGQQSDNGGDPKASASVVTDAKFKKLKKRVAALERKASVPGPPGPTGATGAQGPPGPSTGPAGGGLTGTYPNPTIAADAVGSGQVINGSLGAVDVKTPYVQIGPGDGTAANTRRVSTASCGGDRLLGGGYAWSVDNPVPAIEMAVNAPDGNPGDPTTGWTAVGRSAVSNTLFAWAVCLPS